MKCKNCRHSENWHYGKELGNKENDCRCIYQHKEEGIKSCFCEKMENKK